MKRILESARYFILVPVIAFLGASLSYCFLEKPIRDLKDRFFPLGQEET